MRCCNINTGNIHPALTDCYIQLNTAGQGGGISCLRSNAETDGCIISENQASTGDRNGGGFHIDRCSPEILGCTIEDNHAVDLGGGLYMHQYCDGELTGCDILGNNAGDEGGGLYLYEECDPLLYDCSIVENLADKNGGGLYLGNQCRPNLQYSLIDDNDADDYNGGGLYGHTNCDPELTHCTIRGNTCNDLGGGAYFEWDDDPEFINCLFAKNMTSAGSYGEGGALNFYKSCEATLTHCTFTDNSSHLGDAICAGNWNGMYPSLFTLTNCILWDGEYTIHNYNGSTFAITYSDVEGGWTGTGNIDADPLFVDPVSDDYHITWNSPCRDSGDNAVIADPFDIDGEDRILDGTTDMGFDEYHLRYDVTGNFSPGGSICLHFVGPPNAMTGVFIGSGLLDPPLHHAWGDF